MANLGMPHWLLDMVLLNTPSPIHGFFRPAAIAYFDLVCKGWREATIVLWRRPLLHSGDRHASFMRVFRGDHPLDIIVDMDGGDQAARATVENWITTALGSGRIRTLRLLETTAIRWLFLSSPFPGLCLLEISAPASVEDLEDQPTFDVTLAPTIHSLHFEGYQPANLSGYDPLHLTSLTIADPMGPPLPHDALSAFLRSASSLAELTLTDWPGHAFHTVPYPSPSNLLPPADAPTWVTKDTKAFAPLPRDLTLPALASVSLLRIPHGLAYGMLYRMQCPNLRSLAITTQVHAPNQNIPVHHPGLCRLLRHAYTGRFGLKIRLLTSTRLTVCEGGAHSALSVDVEYDKDLVHLIPYFLQAIHNAIRDLAGELRVDWPGISSRNGSSKALWAHPLVVHARLPSVTTIGLTSAASDAFNRFFPFLNDDEVFPRLRRVAIHQDSSLNLDRLPEMLAPRIAPSRFGSGIFFRVLYDVPRGEDDEAPGVHYVLGMAQDVTSALARAFPRRVSMEPSVDTDWGELEICW